MRITHAPPIALPRNLTPESIGSLERARQTYRAITDTTPRLLLALTRRVVAGARVIAYYWYRARGDNPRHTAAAHVDRELCALANAGAPMEAAVRLEQHVGASIRRVWGGVGVRALAELDVLDEAVDHDDERLQTRRLTSAGGATPVMLREEAQACWRSSAVYAERAVALEAEAERMDAMRSVARSRLGVGAR